MQDRAMADADVVADARRMTRIGVHHHAVLEIRAGADADRVQVGADDGVVPDAAVRADGDPAGDDRTRRDPGGGRGLRDVAADLDHEGILRTVYRPITRRLS
ncbi:hypothetical protein Q0Z83_015260 [Actinoplanes sichuanensis]|nr:hypothetical protein Q0Z83_015260 [Actinoplanes sichuanensis]